MKFGKYMSVERSALLALLALAIGCGPTQVATNSAPNATSDAKSQYLLTEEPVDAIPVGEAREKVQDAEQITLVGTIGGSSKPFVDGLAAFTIVDPKVPFCAAEEGCPTPWDYCCTQDQVKDNIATIKIVDSAGQPVVKDAQQLLNVEELSTVVVSGTAERDEQGNLTVAATKIFVRPVPANE